MGSGQEHEELKSSTGREEEKKEGGKEAFIRWPLLVRMHPVDEATPIDVMVLAVI